MAVAFDYKVRDRSGRLVEGQLEGDSLTLVASRLREMGYTPISIEPKPLGALQRDVAIPLISNRVKPKELAVVTRQLATMINAGLTLVRSIGILADQVDNKELARVLGAVRLDVEHGSSLSEALARHPKTFETLYVAMVRAGETAGTLDTVLLELASTMEKSVELRRRVKSAMTYPVVVLAVVLLILTAMLLFVVPTFKKMYTTLHGTLPLPTRILLQVSHVATHSWYFVAVGLILIVIGVVRWKKTPTGRKQWDRLALKPPIFGKLVHKIALARFARTLASMVDAGVPILEALEIVADNCGNSLVADATWAAQDGVRVGELLSTRLATQPVMPSMVVQMIEVGEQTGALDTMLQKIADFYESEVSATVDAMASLIEPLLIVVLGAVVGTMVISLYLPMFDIYKLIK